MTIEQELRELDGWIAEHVMGWRLTNYETGKPAKWDLKSQNNDGYTWNGVDEAWTWKPTTDPAAAMQVLEQCAKMTGSMFIGVANVGNEYRVFCPVFPGLGLHKAETLPLAICLFAKQLFSK